MSPECVQVEGMCFDAGGIDRDGADATCACASRQSLATRRFHALLAWPDDFGVWVWSWGIKLDRDLAAGRKPSSGRRVGGARWSAGVGYRSAGWCVGRPCAAAAVADRGGPAECAFDAIGAGCLVSRCAAP